jgi:hypothetical protein
MSKELAPFVNEVRHRLLETLAVWPIHRRTVDRQSSIMPTKDFVPTPDAILVSLIHQTVQADQDTIGKLRAELAASHEIQKELTIQLRKCREAGSIQAVHEIVEPQMQQVAA